MSPLQKAPPQQQQQQPQQPLQRQQLQQPQNIHWNLLKELDIYQVSKHCHNQIGSLISFAALVIGGRVSRPENPIHTNVELFPSTDCKIPALPEPRYDHVSFATEDGTVVTCGGRNLDSRYGFQDCLALNISSKQWQRGVIGNLDQARIDASAVTMPVGVFVLGGNWLKGRKGRSWAVREDESTEKRSLFLKSGSTDWVYGPTLPIKHKWGCTLSISKNKFLMISGWNLREFDTSIGGPTSDTGWSPENTYPELQDQRHGSYGCARLGNKVIQCTIAHV